MTARDDVPDDAAELLGVYLSDHMAGATAGSQRAARLARAEADSSDGPALQKLATDIEADMAALSGLMDAAGFEPSRLKSGAASVAEKIGALKLNGRLVERSPLTTIVEIEAMQMAVRGKRSLWETLRVALPQPTSVDLDELVGRADAQLELLSTLHAQRTAATFQRTSSPGGE